MLPLKLALMVKELIVLVEELDEGCSRAAFDGIFGVGMVELD